MDDPINDGGPAFPVPECEDRESGPYLPAHHGMTLRDWFAGQVLQGCLCMADNGDIAASHTIATLAARNAYSIADAMLKARAAK